MSFLRSRSSETSVGMNNLFDTSNCLYYLCALFSVVQLSVPLTYYIFVFFLGPIQGVFYVGKDEFITWRWNAMYNRREYWHTVINAAMVFCWFLEIHYTDFHSSTVDSGRTYLLGGKFRVGIRCWLAGWIWC